MVDGLVQQIYKELCSENELGLDATIILTKYKFKLIERIKKMKTTEGDYYDNGIYVDLKELIGDNK